MKARPERVFQKHLHEHPELMKVLETFQLSSAQYERALRAVASNPPPPTTSSQWPFEVECRGDLSEAD
jgi:hypothetical protein